MADNFALPPSGTGLSGGSAETKEISAGIHRQLVSLQTYSGAAGNANSPIRAEDEASASADAGMVMLAKRADTPANSSGTDGDYEPPQISAGKLWTKPIGSMVTITTTMTRPADVTAYAANDNIETSTSAPTSGGLTLSGAARISGGSGVITDILVISNNDPATLLQGEIWIFDSAVSANQNDNAAFALADADSLLLVAVVPFTLATTVAGSGTNSYAHIPNLSIGFTCVGSANLRFKLKAKNAYTPASSETITLRVKIIQVD